MTDSRIKMNGGAAASAPGPADAEPVEKAMPTAPAWAGPAIPVAEIYWAKDIALMIPGGGAAQTRIKAWEPLKLAPSYVIQFLPKIRMFWVCSLQESRLDGQVLNPARWVPVEHAVTWSEWRGDVDIPASARRRMALAAAADPPVAAAG